MSTIPKRIVAHLGGNAVAYVALFAALGGTSYAAVNLKAGSVRTAAIAPAAVTHPKLAARSITQQNIVAHSLTAAAFKRGVLHGSAGADGSSGGNGTAGAAGPTGPAGPNGSGSIVVRSQGTGGVSAPHAATTNIPLSSGSWTQAANELNLIAGSVTLKTPSACTGSFGNSIVVSVDGTPETIGIVPTGPASTTVTIPIAVGELMEPGSSAPHQITAALANSCTKGGEDYSVSGAKFDVLSFH
jgi:hypothetical protein